MNAASCCATPAVSCCATPAVACCTPPAAGCCNPPVVGFAARARNAWRRADGAVVATVSILLAIAVLAPTQLADTLVFTRDSALGIGPFLLVSVLTAAWLRAAGADRLIGRAFVGHPAKAIVFASLLAVVDPFCSCGVIPVIAALLLAGVPLAPVMAFWAASPIMAPDMYFITAGALGFEFATAKALATVGIGIAAGSVTWALQRLPAFANPLRATACNACGGDPLADGSVHWRFWQERERVVGFIRSAVGNGLFLGKWLVLAFVLESLMVAWLPTELLAAWVGDNTFAIPLASLIGVPAYLNGYAAVPVVAGLIEGGMSPAAALSFMTAGAMTSIPAALAVYSLVNRRVFALYLVLALVLSTLVGYGYAAWLAV